MIKNIFNTLYGYATYKPPNRGNQFKQNKSTPRMAFQVPIIAPVSALTKIQINNNNPTLQKDMQKSIQEARSIFPRLNFVGDAELQSQLAAPLKEALEAVA